MTDLLQEVKAWLQAHPIPQVSGAEDPPQVRGTEVLFVNRSALQFFQALHGGRPPAWVRRWRTRLCQINRLPQNIAPPKSYWWSDYCIIFAIRFTDYSYRSDAPASHHVYTVERFVLKFYDVLEHHAPHRSLPCESYAWEPISRGDLSQPRLVDGWDGGLGRPDHPVVYVRGDLPHLPAFARVLADASVKTGRRLPWEQP
jgi:hypothetical protein